MQNLCVLLFSLILISVHASSGILESHICGVVLTRQLSPTCMAHYQSINTNMKSLNYSSLEKQRSDSLCNSCALEYYNLSAIYRSNSSKVCQFAADMISLFCVRNPAGEFCLSSFAENSKIVLPKLFNSSFAYMASPSFQELDCCNKAFVYIFLEGVAVLFQKLPGISIGSSFSFPRDMKTCNSTTQILTTTTSAPLNPDQPSSQSTIIYASAGGVTAFILCAGAASFFIMKKRKAKNDPNNEKSETALRMEDSANRLSERL
jgi:hypothetical protein